MNEQTEAEVRHHIEYKMGGGELAGAIGRRMLEILDTGGPPDYQKLWREAVLLPLPEIVYHTAPTSAREAILRDGLIAADPSAGKYAHLDIGQPTGVYVGAKPDTIGMWCTEAEWDVWEVRTEGIEWSHDRMNPGCWSLATSVPPSAVKLHATLSWD